MKAVRYEQYGPPEVLQIVDLPKPELTQDQVLIRIHATTVTAGDWRMRKPDPQAARLYNGLFAPHKVQVLGFEVAGVVEDVGGQVSRFKVGDEVYGPTGLLFGGYAEYICLPENGTEKTGFAAIMPTNLRFEEAAAVPTGALAALNLLKMGGITPGMKVLVIGASGSVGSYALQLVRYHGCQVDGVCGSHNVDLVKDLGAENVYDYSRSDFRKSGQQYDLVFDAAGRMISGITKRGIRNSLTPAGKFVSVEMSRSDRPQDLESLTGLIEGSHLRPVIDRVFSLEEIVQAHKYVESGRKSGGNVVIRVLLA